MPLDKLVKCVSQLSGLRELLDSRDPEGILLGYGAVVELNPAITPAMVDKLLATRWVCGWVWVGVGGEEGGRMGIGLEVCCNHTASNIATCLVMLAESFC